MLLLLRVPAVHTADEWRFLCSLVHRHRTVAVEVSPDCSFEERISYASVECQNGFVSIFSLSFRFLSGVQ
jgi:hypothetical protein